MPELPEVESARKMLARCCKGQCVEKVNLKEQGGGARDGMFDDIVVDENVSELSLNQALEGREIIEVGRRGKQLYFIHDKPPHSLWHFGMTGYFYVQGDVPPSYKRFKPDLNIWPPKFCKVELQFKNGVKLAFCDGRRLGRIKLRDDPLNQEPLCILAPDPIINPPMLQDFIAGMRKSAAPVKSVLMDQNRVVCGIGNWIADEVCYQSQVHPSAPCNTLSDAQLQRLRTSIISVCKYASEVDAVSDKFPPSWLFHYRWGKTPGKMPDGSEIVFDVVGARTTAIVPSVQIMGELDSIPNNLQNGKAKSPKVIMGNDKAASAKKGRNHKVLSISQNDCADMKANEAAPAQKKSSKSKQVSDKKEETAGTPSCSRRK